ncbi:uncharacterized protein LOC131675999 [Topomyia yanbarensis]|uniref:uncharacterized protein LOC131675999 n=1 Tax=Topomyia yanbarensis TaxID=2498891 RepID=UPI00273AB40E|nr:uncharacterized protein LOC131675999 [Topomyia yanbarensis]
MSESMPSERYDNGAVGIEANEPPRKSKKRNSKFESVLKELAAAKANNALLNEEWSKAQETIKSLQATLNTPRSEASDVNSDEFNGDVGPSSTHFLANQREASTELSRFMSSVNQMSVSSVTVPECKPLVGSEEIGRQDFEAWKELLLDSMQLAGIVDEATQFIIFKVKAGQKLLEIFRNTKSTSEAPDQNDHPFLNAMFRLKAYFTSGSDVMLQRRRLALMEQKHDENDLSFIMRVGATARLCEFVADKEFEEIVSTVAEHAHNREVRTAALKLLSRKGTFTDLVDEVREIEAIRLNEEYFNKKHGNQNQVTIARVAEAEAYPRYSGRPGRGRYDTQHTPRGGAVYARNTNWRGSNSSIPQRCFRCNSLYHKSTNCFAMDKICRNCGVKGHLQRACRSFVREKSMQQQGERVRDQKLSEISAVSTKEEDKLEDQIIPDTVNVPQIHDLTTSMVAQLAHGRDDGVIKALVSGFPCEFLIDSGAQVNTITEQSFKKIIENEDYKKGLHNMQYGSDQTLKAYAVSGQIPVIGMFEAFLFVSEDRPVLLEKFYIVKESRSLLGRPTATRYCILLLGLQVQAYTDASRESQHYCVDIATICSEKAFPKFNIPPVIIRYDETKPPCRNIFFNIPIAVKPRVEERLQQLVAANIIEKITDEMDHSFCSSMLVIPKGKEDFRLVIDLRGPN